VSAFEAAPWLGTISRHKGPVFAAVGALLIINYRVAVIRPRQMNCAPGEICHVDSPAMRMNRFLFWASVVIYAGALLFTSAALWWIRRLP